MTLNKHGQRALKDLILAVEEKGSNCSESRTPEKWTGWVDEAGVEHLPSQEEAARLCEGCPLRGRECREYWSKGDTTWGVLDGKVVDLWKISGVDLFEPNREEE